MKETFDILWNAKPMDILVALSIACVLSGVVMLIFHRIVIGLIRRGK